MLLLRLRGRKSSRVRHWRSQVLRHGLRVDRPIVLVHIAFSAVRVLAHCLDGFPLFLAQHDKIKASREQGIDSVGLVVSKGLATNKSDEEDERATYLRKSCFSSRALSRSAC